MIKTVACYMASWLWEVCPSGSVFAIKEWWNETHFILSLQVLFSTKGSPEYCIAVKSVIYFICRLSCLPCFLFWTSGRVCDAHFVFAREYVRYNFRHWSAIFGLVTGLQHAVLKQIIRQVFRVLIPVFQYFIKWGEKRRSRWSHGAGILFVSTIKCRCGKTRGYMLARQREGPN